MPDASIEIAKRHVVYDLPTTAEVTVRRNIPYRTTDTETLTFDLYRPSTDAVLPIVLFVTGYSDLGMRAFVGCDAKDMQSYVDWGHLIAASGLATITYTTSAPETDVYELLGHLRQESAALGIDGSNIGLWSCSGNVPNALGVLMNVDVRCAALCYGFMMDLDGTTDVAEAAARYRFSNPFAGKSINDIPRVPMFIARAGRDEMPHLNDGIDRFVEKALKANLPITLINHPDGPHAFDLFDDTVASRNIIEQLVRFLQLQLVGTIRCV
jgi:hypothetical protein